MKSGQRRQRELRMANFLEMLKAYLTDYQPELKAELVQRGELLDWLEMQSEMMLETKAQLMAKFSEHYPTLSPLQLDMEAERTVIETFLTPP